MDNMPLILAVLTFVCIGFGLWQVRRRTIHIPCMLSALILELYIVYLLESGRNVIDTAKESPSLLLIIHIGFATVILVLYAGMICTGLEILFRGRWKKIHQIMAFTMILFKVINLGLSQLVKLSMV